MAVTKITDENIVDVDASKLVGSFGTLDGSNLTNVPIGKSVTKATSDPTQETNPADGVGTLYLNTSSGELFCCVDATTDYNVWKNTGLGTTETIQPYVYTFGGTVSGYVAGGWMNGYASSIESISFTSDGSSQAVSGALSTASYAHANAQSTTHGYVMGGFSGTPALSQIDKYDFSSTNNSVTVANLAVTNDDPTGNNSSTHGYSANGRDTGSWPATNNIEKFAFASDSTTSGHGTTVLASMSQAGQSSATHGYCSGGHTGSSSTNNIDQYSFASEGQAVTYTTMSAPQFYFCGHSSETDGYNSGGSYNTGTNIIEKFSFSSGSGSSDHGDLSYAKFGNAGNSSTANGYSSGGGKNGSEDSNTIEKFSFESNAGSSNIGNLSAKRLYASGIHY